MNVAPRKRFGQNFLQDDSVIYNIINHVDPQPEQHFVEIGPGHGALTLPLIASGCRLDAIEIDRDLIKQWQSHQIVSGCDTRPLETQRFKVHEADVLQFDFKQLMPAQKLRLVGNLPYNISTPVLFRLLEYRNLFSDLHIMLQKEVAERVCATPGNRQYGRLSIMLSTHFKSEVLFDVAAHSFFPAPKVTSSVVHVNVSAEPCFNIANFQHFSRLVKLAFSQRRKTLRNSLKTVALESDFTASGIDSGLRAEALTPKQFARLSNSAVTRIN